MGTRLRSQIMTIFFGLIGISIAIIVYFNVGVFKLSFLADEEQRLRHLGLKAVERILDDVMPSYIGTGEFKSDGHMVGNSPLASTPGLRYFELWDYQGRVLMRSGSSDHEIPNKDSLLNQMRLQPLPTHLFLDHSVPDTAVGPMAQYYDGLPPDRDHSTITYEHLYPVFVATDFPIADVSRLPPAQLKAVLHLSFNVENTSRRLRIVTTGNVLLALTFVLTSLMAIHLWSQHAIQRPMEGLVESMRQLDTTSGGTELSSKSELVNLSKTLHLLALDRLKYQRELEQLNRDLEAQVEEKTLDMKEFFSLVTHDLRIPLAAIQGYCDLLKRKPDQLTERQLTFISRISTANGHALELVRNLLEAMKIEFGTLQPVMETFSVNVLAEEICNELNVDESLPPVVLDPLDEQAEGARVEADRTRIKRVITNLLSNAQKHAPETPQVTLHWKIVPRRGVRIQVSDQGPGIPPEDCKRLFEKFTRVSGSVGNSSGLGLGLYIVSRILQSHNQEVSLRSEVGKGTTFEFHLPLATERR